LSLSLFFSLSLSLLTLLRLINLGAKHTPSCFNHPSPQPSTPDHLPGNKHNTTTSTTL
jgi:hypothetical protein